MKTNRRHKSPPWQLNDLVDIILSRLPKILVATAVVILAWRLPAESGSMVTTVVSKVMQFLK